MKILAPDNPARIAAAIVELGSLGCELIVTTGGLCLNCEQCRFPVCPFGKK